MAKRKGQKDKQRSTKLTYKTKDRVTLNTGVELGCSGRVGNSFSNSSTRRVNPLINSLPRYKGITTKYTERLIKKIPARYILYIVLIYVRKSR
jgi:hypothetical protein